METRTVYENQILRDIQELSEHQQRKLAKLIRFFKDEMIEYPSDERDRTEEFLSVCGTGEDGRSTEKMQEIEGTEELNHETPAPLSKETPISQSFWEPLTLDELAKSQDVSPIMDINILLGGWPGDPDDGFEEENLKIRRRSMVGE